MITTIKEWLKDRITEIATRLPTSVHKDPASFACGYNVGFKAALLQLDALIEESEGQESDSSYIIKDGMVFGSDKDYSNYKKTKE